MDLLFQCLFFRWIQIDITLCNYDVEGLDSVTYMPQVLVCGKQYSWSVLCHLLQHFELRLERHLLLGDILKELLRVQPGCPILQLLRPGSGHLLHISILFDMEDQVLILIRLDIICLEVMLDELIVPQLSLHVFLLLLRSLDGLLVFNRGLSHLPHHIRELSMRLACELPLQVLLFVEHLHAPRLPGGALLCILGNLADLVRPVLPLPYR